MMSIPFGLFCGPPNETTAANEPPPKPPTLMRRRRSGPACCSVGIPLATEHTSAVPADEDVEAFVPWRAGGQVTRADWGGGRVRLRATGGAVLL